VDLEEKHITKEIEHRRNLLVDDEAELETTEHDESTEDENCDHFGTQTQQFVDDSPIYDSSMQSFYRQSIQSQTSSEQAFKGPPVRDNKYKMVF